MQEIESVQNDAPCSLSLVASTVCQSLTGLEGYIYSINYTKFIRNYRQKTCHFQVVKKTDRITEISHHFTRHAPLFDHLGV